MCRNAMKGETHCIYALCNGCKDALIARQGNNTSRRKRAERKTDIDRDERECDHSIENLTMFSDKSYFEKKYLENRDEREDTIPRECVICHGEIIPEMRNCNMTNKVAEV